MHRRVVITHGENSEERVRKRIGQEGEINCYVIAGFVFSSPNKICSSFHHVVLNEIEISRGRMISFVD